VIGPTATAVNIEVQVVKYPNYSTAEVQESVAEALTAWLENWGSGIGGGVSSGDWQNQTVVRIYEVIDYANRAEGCSYVKSGTVKLSLGAAALGTADVNLPGAAPMPTPGTINVIVT
jgi:hypothetical protein